MAFSSKTQQKIAEKNGGLLKGGLRSILSGGKNVIAQNRKVVEAIAAECPTVVDILAGSEAQGDWPESAPSSITFFMQDGRLRFSARVKSAQIKIVGDVQDPKLPWHSIEAAILTGECGQFDYTEYKSTTKEVAEPPH